MRLLVFKESGKWANPPGQGIVTVEAGVPVKVCDFIAKRALGSGRAELVVEAVPKPKSKPKSKPRKRPKAKVGPVEKAEDAGPEPKAEK